MTNLFLHASTGEDPALFPEAVGDDSGHDSRVGCIFDLWGQTHMIACKNKL